MSVLSEVLVKMAASESLLIYRMKGDEYALLALDVSGNIIQNAKQLYKNIRVRIDKAIDERGYDVFLMCRQAHAL